MEAHACGGGGGGWITAALGSPGGACTPCKELHRAPTQLKRTVRSATHSVPGIVAAAAAVRRRRCYSALGPAAAAAGSADACGRVGTCVQAARWAVRPYGTPRQGDGAAGKGQRRFARSPDTCTGLHHALAALGGGQGTPKSRPSHDHPAEWPYSPHRTWDHCTSRAGSFERARCVRGRLPVTSLAVAVCWRPGALQQRRIRRANDDGVQATREGRSERRHVGASSPAPNKHASAALATITTPPHRCTLTRDTPQATRSKWRLPPAAPSSCWPTQTTSRCSAAPSSSTWSTRACGWPSCASPRVRVAGAAAGAAAGGLARCLSRPCTSSHNHAGNADGLGKLRSQELYHACSLLGVRCRPPPCHRCVQAAALQSERALFAALKRGSSAALSTHPTPSTDPQMYREDVMVIDDPQLQDGMRQQWAAAAVAEHVAQAVQRLRPSRVRAGCPACMHWDCGTTREPGRRPDCLCPPPASSAGLHIRCGGGVGAPQPPGCVCGRAAVVGRAAQQQQCRAAAAAVAARKRGPAAQVPGPSRRAPVLPGPSCGGGLAAAVAAASAARAGGAAAGPRARVARVQAPTARVARAAGAPQPDGLVRGCEGGLALSRGRTCMHEQARHHTRCRPLCTRRYRRLWLLFSRYMYVNTLVRRL